MEKTIELSAREAHQLSQMQQEHLQLTAQYGELRMNLDELEKRIRELQSIQRSFIRNVMSNNAIDQFSTARIDGRTIRYTTNEAPPMPVPARPNGATHGEMSTEITQMTKEAQHRWAEEAESK